MEGKTKFQGLKGEQGFTLIELIMVIVILGILAATAIPKYADMRTEARQAAVDGLSGAIAGASSIAHAACIMDAACDATIAGSSVTISGQAVVMDFGYPAATAAGIQAAMDYTAGQFIDPAPVTATTIIYRITGAAAGGCEVVYTESPNATTASITAPATGTCNF